MHEVLATLEDFHQNTLSIFDRVEAAASQADARLASLEGRLEFAADRLEKVRGTNRPLAIRSARTLSSWRGARGTARVLDDESIAALSRATPLPQMEDGVEGSAPTVQKAAEDLAKVVRRVGPQSSSAALAQLRHDNDKLIGTRGRIGAVSDLFLFNSGEQPYKKFGKDFNNLEKPDEEEMEHMNIPAWQRAWGGAPPNLEEDEMEYQPEELVFRAAKPDAVNMILPDVLQGLGGPVADLVYRHQDNVQEETTKPAWERANQARQPPKPRKSMKAGSNAGGGDDQSDTMSMISGVPTQVQVSAAAAPKKAPPAPKGKGAPKATAPAAAPAAPAKGKGKGAPPPPPPGGKGGKGGPPPPPAPKGKGKGKPAPGPPKAKAAAPSSGGPDFLASIEAGAGDPGAMMRMLKKTKGPPEREGPGKVV